MLSQLFHHGSVPLLYMEISLVFVSPQHIISFTLSWRGCLSFCSGSPHVAALVRELHQVFFTYGDLYAGHSDEKSLQLELKPHRAVLFSDCTTPHTLSGAILYVNNTVLIVYDYITMLFFFSMLYSWSLYSSWIKHTLQYTTKIAHDKLRQWYEMVSCLLSGRGHLYPHHVLWTCVWIYKSW